MKNFRLRLVQRLSFWNCMTDIFSLGRSTGMSEKVRLRKHLYIVLHEKFMTSSFTPLGH